MKRYRFIFLFLLFSYTACKPKDKAASSENDIDAARNFIQAALNCDYQKARSYMLADSTNDQHMNAIERVTLSAEEKYGLAQASIHISEVANVVKDSVTIVIYSNTFKNNPDTLKVLKQNGQWLVDFKYLYEHDADTIYKKQLSKGSPQ